MTGVVLLVYAIAHASKAIQPIGQGGSFGQRIKVSSSSESLLVGAYATKSSQGTRYSLVVLNSGGNNAQTGISFQGKTVGFFLASAFDIID